MSTESVLPVPSVCSQDRNTDASRRCVVLGYGQRGRTRLRCDFLVHNICSLPDFTSKEPWPHPGLQIYRIWKEEMERSEPPTRQRLRESFGKGQSPGDEMHHHKYFKTPLATRAYAPAFYVTFIFYADKRTGLEGGTTERGLLLGWQTHLYEAVEPTALQRRWIPGCYSSHYSSEMQRPKEAPPLTALEEEELRKLFDSVEQQIISAHRDAMRTDGGTLAYHRGMQAVQLERLKASGLWAPHSHPALGFRRKYEFPHRPLFLERGVQS